MSVPVREIANAMFYVRDEANAILEKNIYLGKPKPALSDEESR